MFLLSCEIFLLVCSQPILTIRSLTVLFRSPVGCPGDPSSNLLVSPKQVDSLPTFWCFAKHLWRSSPRAPNLRVTHILPPPSYGRRLPKDFVFSHPTPAAFSREDDHSFSLLFSIICSHLCHCSFGGSKVSSTFPSTGIGRSSMAGSKSP